MRPVSHIIVAQFYPDADNEIRPFCIVPFPARIREVDWWTGAALGASLGVDLLDGGAAGSGTTGITSSADNLNGYETDDGLSYELTAGFRLRVRFDNYGSATDVGVSVYMELFLPGIG